MFGGDIHDDYYRLNGVTMPQSLTVKLELSATADFNLLVKDRRKTVVSGTDAVYTVEAEWLTGYTDDINLTVAGSPSGATAVFADNVLSSGESSALTIGTAGVSPGTYTLITIGGAGANDYEWLLGANADRLIDWSKAGVWYGGVKGIPSYPVGITVNTTTPSHQYYCDPTGAVDCAVKLQAAIDACTIYNAVLMPAGTYKIGSVTDYERIWMPTGKVLRGAGAGQTILLSYYAWYPIYFYNGSYSFTATNVTSGYAKGSDTIAVASTSGLAVGDVVIIDQLNEAGLVTQTGVGSCGWCGRDGLNGTRAMAETLVIANIAGTTITLNRPLYYNYTAAYVPQLYRGASSPLTNSGVENLALRPASGVDGGGFYSQGTKWCWIKNVDVSEYGIKGIMTHLGTYGLEVRHCAFREANMFSGNRGYGVHMFYYPSDCLIEDNVFYFLHTGIDFEAGGSGNVFAYNYIRTTRHGNEPAWLQAGIGLHGAHPYMNLFEGNIVNKIHFDNYFGSASHNMMFRNHINRLNQEWDPPMVYDKTCCIIDADSYYQSFIGNILGTAGMTGLYEPNPVTSIENYPTVWKVGYDCCAGGGAPHDANTAATLLRHGNYCYLDDTTRWTDGLGYGIPTSLYLTSKPSWFGAVPWPAIGPDVGGYVNDIPAKDRWDVFAVSDDIDDLVGE